ncbi:MAG: hypothetical protein HWE27_08915 [Gammaproteobacteria bacterium]|nr:hypothetical protein [Gammaproteobacteria bacterium]
MINLNIFVVLLSLMQGDANLGAGGQAEPMFDEPQIVGPKNPEPVIQECVEWPICPPDQTN